MLSAMVFRGFHHKANILSETFNTNIQQLQIQPLLLVEYELINLSPHTQCPNSDQHQISSNHVSA